MNEITETIKIDLFEYNEFLLKEKEYYDFNMNNSLFHNCLQYLLQGIEQQDLLNMIYMLCKNIEKLFNRKEELLNKCMGYESKRYSE